MSAQYLLGRCPLSTEVQHGGLVPFLRAAVCTGVTVPQTAEVSGDTRRLGKAQYGHPAATPHGWDSAAGGGRGPGPALARSDS